MGKYSTLLAIAMGLIGCSATHVVPSYANDIDVEAILTEAIGKVVHLRVQGKPAPGEMFSIPIHGTGVVIRTKANSPRRKYRILTAGHVVLPDGKWDRLGARRNRDVYVIAETSIGAQEYRPITGVLVNKKHDVAQVVASSRTRISAKVRAVNLAVGQKYVVVSWGLDGSKIAESATANLAEVVGTDSLDPRLVRLSGKFIPTQSGSPIFDADGFVVAILVMRELVANKSRIGLALPVAEIANWIDGVLSKPVLEPKSQRLSAVISDASGLCIFLGKKSALVRDKLRHPDAPFGRAVLRAIRDNHKTDEVVGPKLNITREAGGINIRSRCPELRNDKAYYGSIVTVLNPNAKIELVSVKPLKYLDDIFYWGTIKQITLPKN